MKLFPVLNFSSNCCEIHVGSLGSVKGVTEDQYGKQSMTIDLINHKHYVEYVAVKTRSYNVYSVYSCFSCFAPL